MSDERPALPNQDPKLVGIAEFTVTQSSMLKILLDDGTRLHVQLVPVRVSKTDALTPDGQPMYYINFQNIIDQIPPEGKITEGMLKKGV